MLARRSLLVGGAAMAASDRELGAGWRQLAAVRARGAAAAPHRRPARGRIAGVRPLRLRYLERGPLEIGPGDHDFFRGSMRDLRMNRRGEHEIGAPADETGG